jgi:hypothetical protein
MWNQFCQGWSPRSNRPDRAGPQDEFTSCRRSSVTSVETTWHSSLRWKLGYWSRNTGESAVHPRFLLSSLVFSPHRVRRQNHIGRAWRAYSWDLRLLINTTCTLDHFYSCVGAFRRGLITSSILVRNLHWPSPLSNLAKELCVVKERRRLVNLPSSLFVLSNRCLRRNLNFSTLHSLYQPPNSNLWLGLVVRCTSSSERCASVIISRS